MRHTSAACRPNRQSAQWEIQRYPDTFTLMLSFSCNCSLGRRIPIGRLKQSARGRSRAFILRWLRQSKSGLAAGRPSWIYLAITFVRYFRSAVRPFLAHAHSGVSGVATSTSTAAAAASPTHTTARTNTSAFRTAPNRRSLRPGLRARIWGQETTLIYRNSVGLFGTLDRGSLYS